MDFKQISIDIKIPNGLKKDGYEVAIGDILENVRFQIENMGAGILGETVNDMSEHYVKDLIKNYMNTNCEMGMLDDLIELYKEDEQFKEAVDNGYALLDYDEWKHFQKVIGCEISYERFIKISGLLYEEDISIMDIPCIEKAE